MSESTPNPTDPSPDDPPPVEQQREELAETVDALAQKLDVPARVGAAASETAHTAKAKADENRPVLIGVAAAAAVAVTVALVIRRRRRRRPQTVRDVIEDIRRDAEKRQAARRRR